MQVKCGVKGGTIPLRSPDISRKLYFSGALAENEVPAYIMSFWMVELDYNKKCRHPWLQMIFSETGVAAYIMGFWVV